jgi:hypothetical protein
MLRRTLPASWFLIAAALAQSAPLTLTVVPPDRPRAGYFTMGTARSSTGHVLTVDSHSLRLDGQPWMPAMGEFHYTRYPANEWRDELLKMKAGGISIVSTYVFWIHHEEVEGQWDWSGQRDLRRFVETAGDVGLSVVVRCGPWCHGEVRNGGLPEWAVERKDWKLRSMDPKFLAAVHELYGQIATQLRGLLWKDGGPVVGIQLDNEYRGPAEYLLALKQIARDVGLDVPLYTRTGWPALTTPMPVGAILPLYGAYAEGFWDRELTSMPGRYWAAFQFSTLRTDAAIATELLGNRAAKDEADVAQYPYLTCEIGGGMMNSYHRRILIDPRDIEATTLVKIGGGSTLPGYYMYQGGTNPEGRRTTLMEAQDTLTTNYNDLPVKTYDFQAPLGEFGEVRPQYHRLRRLHLFLHDYGADLTAMAPALPDERPSGRDDGTTLRWAVRSNGHRGFVFVNNYERGRTLPAKPGVQFALGLVGGGKVVFPTSPVSIPSGAICWWPFNLDVGGVTLISATAEPVTHIVDAAGTRTLFFAATPGVPPEFVFDAGAVQRMVTNGHLTEADGRYVVRDVAPGHDVAVRILGKGGDVVQFVVLDDADSLALWKGPLAGRNRVILTRTNLVFEGEAVRATTTDFGEQELEVFPAPRELLVAGDPVPGAADGVFRSYALPAGFSVKRVPFTRERAAGELRTISIGPGRQGVAMEPKDGDFAQAAVWRIDVPRSIDPARRPLLRFSYVGDVARVMVGDRLVTDDFYNGRSRDVGLWRLPDEGRGSGMRFEIIPLQKSAPIFLPDSARPAFGDEPAIATLRGVTLTESTTFTITARPAEEPPLPANFRTDANTPRPRRGF